LRGDFAFDGLRRRIKNRRQAQQQLFGVRTQARNDETP